MQVQVLCPGLFGPDLFGPALARPGPGLGRDPIPPTPALDRLLTRADRQAAPERDPLGTLAAAFDLGATDPRGEDPGPSPSPRDLPSAPLCLLAQAPGLAPSGCWFHADPIHLRPDRDRLLAFGGPGLGVTAAESTALAHAFNDHFRADGLDLALTGLGDWYLRVLAAPALTTSPLHRVSGQVVDPYLPTGPDARAWGRWQNEAQMLFFQHPVNQAREAAGRPTISGVWTWGGGALPQVRRTPVTPDLILATHPLAMGLAQAAGVPLLEPGAIAGPGLPRGGAGTGPGSALIVWDALWWPALDGDLAAWSQALGGLETLIARLLVELTAGRIQTLSLDDGETQVFRLNRWGLGRLWRRRGGLRDRLARPPPTA